MITFLILTSVLVVFGIAATAIMRARTLDSIEHAPRGDHAPDGGHMPAQVTHGALFDNQGGANGHADGRYTVYATNAPLAPWSPGIAHPHVVGDCVGNVPPNGIGWTAPLCSGGCMPRPPSQMWLRTDQIAVTRLAAGSQVNVNLDTIPARDAQGRYAHVAGIRMFGTYRFVLADASTSAYSGYQQLTAFQNIILEDASGWQYWAGLDGRQIYDDAWIRRRRTPVATGALAADIAANAGAGNVDHVIFLDAPLSHDPWAKGAKALMGAVPLALLQARGASALTFVVSGASLIGAPTDVSGGGFVTNSLEVWLNIIYADKMYLTRPWQLETYLLTDLNGNLNRNDRDTDYAMIYALPEDNGGQYLNDYGATTIAVAGTTVASAYTMAASGEMWFRAYAMFLDDPGWQDTSPSVNSNGSLRIMPLVYREKDQMGLASGVISYQYASRTRTSSRYLHRTIACQTAQRFTMTCGSNGQMVGVDANGQTGAPSKDKDAIIVQH